MLTPGNKFFTKQTIVLRFEMNDHICFSHYFMAKLSLKKYSTMYLKWLLSFKRRSQAIIHHELSATSFELEIICFVMRRLFIFCKVGIFLYHVSRMCKFSFCCKGREYVTKSRRYVRLTICVKKRKDMQKFFLSFEYFESDEWK